MCGIFCLLAPPSQPGVSTDGVINSLRHRGPDSACAEIIMSDNTVTMIHTRLKINGDNTPQPITSADESLVLIMNGEIFNYMDLSNDLGYTCTKSDCEIILPLYERYKSDIPRMLKLLNGQFSFVLYDKREGKVLIARDMIGVTPLYISTNTTRVSDSETTTNSVAIASEMKAITQMNFDNSKISVFEPRHYVYDTISNILRGPIVPIPYLDLYARYANLDLGIADLRGEAMFLQTIKKRLTDAVRLQCQDIIQNGNNITFGVLLSGGLDSSLIARLVVDTCKQLGYTKPIKTFSIGITPQVPDLVAARTVAEYLGTEHHEYTFSVDQGIAALQEVIWHTETYDCTSVRASTAMFLLTRKIKEDYPDLKVLFSGELSDELFCYLYGANAPSEQDYQRETVELTSRVHMFDCLRANKTCMAHSIEVRVPFTDPYYVDCILSAHPRWKMFGANGRMEKQALRDAFSGYLPESVLYRKKEQFSDGVSGFRGKEDNWIDGVKCHAEDLYSDEEFNKLQADYVHNKPDTKEKLLYRQIFSKLFHSDTNTSEYTVEQWKPKWSDTEDPSGRVQTFWVKN